MGPSTASTAGRTPRTHREWVSILLAAAMALFGLVAVAPAASAAGLAPTGVRQNLPDSGVCGNNGERWVKLTSGGPVTASGSANSGQPKWTAEYTSAPGEFRVTDVYDEFGNIVLFNAVVGGAQRDNPVWEFDTASSSPLLSVPNNGNFSQFSICALPPQVTATVAKVVQGDGDPATVFTIAVDCRLGEGADNLADPATLTLTGGQSGTFTAPSGAGCTVSEPTLPDGFELVSITPSEFTMPTPSRQNPTPTVAVTVTNKVSTAPLTISKTVIGGSGTFTFDVSCVNGSGAVVFTADNLSITVDTDGATESTALTVPGNSTCTVTEVDVPAGYEPTEESITVTAGGTAAFTNTGRGALKITKEQFGGPAEAEFTINYSCTSSVEGESRTGSVTLTDAESETVGGLLGGSVCTVGENAPGYAVVITPEVTSIVAGQTGEVTATNTRETTELTITKRSEGGIGTFTFEVSCTGPGESFTDTVTIDTTQPGTPVAVVVDEIATGLECTVTETDLPAGFTAEDAEQSVTAGGAVEFVNIGRGNLTIAKVQSGGPADATFTIAYSCTDGTEGTVTLAGGTSETIEGILGGSTCTLDESPVGYTVAVDPVDGINVVAGQTSTGTVTNTRQTTDLTVRKTATGGTGTFTFDISCTGPGESFTDSVEIEITEAGSTESAVIDGIPTGLECTVTEAALPTGWTVDHETATVTAGGTVSFTNVARGSLTVRKVQNGGPAGTSFTIGYSCTDGTEGTLTLAGGDSETIEGILGGSTCTVTESAEGYTVDIDPADGVTITPGGNAPVTVTNTRKTTDLTVSKTAVGGTGNFTFDISCTGPGESFTATVDIEVSEAGGTNTATLDGIPTGLECTVTETVPAGWVVNHESSTATAGGTVSFTNTRIVPVTMVKFYDANRNGVRDAGEPGLPGWKFKLDGTVYTAAAGGSVTVQKPAGTYPVAEGSASGWINTTPKSTTVTAPGTVQFGNVCLGGTSHTIGFWRNTNGQKLIDAADLAALRALPLVNKNGTPFDPTTFAQYATWLQAAEASNTAYMTSAQLSATVLSLRQGFLSGGQFVYAPGVNGADAAGFVTLTRLINETVASLTAHPVTVSASAARTYQQVLLKALDGVNNATNVVSTTPCAIPTTFTF